MTHDDDSDRKPSDLGDLTNFFAARAAEAAEHASTCTAPTCLRCGRLRCKVCGQTFGHDGGVGDHCATCRTTAYRRAWSEPALSTLPRAFAGATLGQEWLSGLVGSRTMSGVQNALSAPRVAFVGPAGTGKTSLAVAMFRAVVAADAPTPSRSWVMGLLTRGFGAEHLYVSAFALAKARSNAPFGREAELVERALRAPLVLIDELGGEDPRHASAVTEVLYERHADGRATWVTTGVGAREIAQRYGGGIARKVFEDATVFELGRRPQ